MTWSGTGIVSDPLSERTAIPDWPLVDDTGVGILEEGFMTDEALVLGIRDWEGGFDTW